MTFDRRRISQGRFGSLPSPFWEANDFELRRLAKEGMTTAQVAKRLNVSKNAVIGRAYRIGIVWARGRPKMSAVPTKPKVEFPPPGRCVFPIGHPGELDFRFCGEPVVEIGEPYCPTHWLCAYRPQQRKEAA